MGLALDRLLHPRKKVASMRNKLGNYLAGGAPYRPRFTEKLAPCSGECPSGARIRDVLTTIANSEKDGWSYHESFAKAFTIIAKNNPFPAVCGRVCPHPCEGGCNRQYKEGALAINGVERFIGDYAIEHDLPLPVQQQEFYPEKIAIIGAGPAGLSAAYQMAALGYKTTVFEAFQKPGGMLRYGIPDYRLPQDVLDKEIARIEKLGVEIRCNTVVGKDISLEQLRKEYRAIFVGIGAHKGRSLGLQNEDADNFFTVIEFLNQINSGKQIPVGDKVVVIGGGDAAIDAARICRRLGAEVTIIYRRTRKEMPAIEKEVLEAEEEKVAFTFLATPVELVKKQNRIVRIKCQKMQLGAPDRSGRCRPAPIANEFVELEASAVIAAIGQMPNFVGMEVIADYAYHERHGIEELDAGSGWMRVESGGSTQNPHFFAGGDVLGLSLVTIAIYQGRVAATTMHAQLRGIPQTEEPKKPIANKYGIHFDYYQKSARHEVESLPVKERLQSLTKEFVPALTEEQVIAEAKRCMSCGLCFDCGNCRAVCGENVMPKQGKKKGDIALLDLLSCKGCRHCMDECPCGFIEMIDPNNNEFIRASMRNS